MVRMEEFTDHNNTITVNSASIVQFSFKLVLGFCRHMQMLDVSYVDTLEVEQ